MATNRISLTSTAFASTVKVPRLIEFGGVDQEVEITAEYFASKRCEPEDIAEACSDPVTMAQAVSARMIADPAPKEAAVYVIGPIGQTEVCKIGVAQNPAERLSQLQAACWEELKLHALFWMVEGNAFGIEKLSHRIADGMGKRIHREWVGMSGGGAAYVVGAVVHSTARVKVADSAMWLRQRLALMALRGDRILIAEGNDTRTGMSKPKAARTGSSLMELPHVQNC